MRAFAISLTRDRAHAEDLVHDTVVEAWTAIDRFGPETKLRAWLFTLLRTSFYLERRRAALRIAEPGDTIGARPARPGDDGFALADFRRAFETLPDLQREALILVRAEGFSYAEAAAICDCAIGTIKSRANRGRQRLAAILAPEHAEPGEMTEHASAARIGRTP